MAEKKATTKKKNSPAAGAPAGAKKAPEGTVEVILLKGGTHYGQAGDHVHVDPAVADEICKIRRRDLGGEHGHEEFRVAKRADEVEPIIPIGQLSQGEAAALGIKNIVKTPPDSIMPKGMAGLPLPGDPDYDESLGANQKPRKLGSNPAAESPAEDNGSESDEDPSEEGSEEDSEQGPGSEQEQPPQQ